MSEIEVEASPEATAAATAAAAAVEEVAAREEVTETAESAALTAEVAAGTALDANATAQVAAEASAYAAETASVAHEEATVARETAVAVVDRAEEAYALAQANSERLSNMEASLQEFLNSVRQAAEETEEESADGEVSEVKVEDDGQSGTPEATETDSGESERRGGLRRRRNR